MHYLGASVTKKWENSQNHSTIENILRQFRELQGIDIFARQSEK